MSNPLINDLQQLPQEHVQLARCQVDVSFPPGFKTGSRPHCPWYVDCHGRPQIVEVKDTGWETYHFPGVADAERFVEITVRRVSEGSFAEGKLPLGAKVIIQLRATLDVTQDVVATASVGTG